MDEKTQIDQHTEEVKVAAPEPVKLSKPAELLRKSAEYLEIVSGGKRLDPEDKNHIVRHTLENFDDYFNRGFLHYRKSVAEAEDFAAIEWTGQGSIIEDIMGRKFIDCLGGFGVYNMGIRHPKIIAAVKAQLDRMPLSSQELLDPLRGFLAELLGRTGSGRSAGVLLHQQRHRRRGRRPQTGPPLHEEDRVSSPPPARSTANRWARCR